VINAPKLTGNASDVWNSYPQDFYTKVPNTPTGTPNTGDIIIWSGSINGGPGHIAICLFSNQDYFISFDQNWVSGSPSVAVTHDYNYVLGWLSPKTIIDPFILLSDAEEKRNENWDLYQAETNKYDDLSGQNLNLQNQLSNLQTEYNQYKLDHPVTPPETSTPPTTPPDSSSQNPQPQTPSNFWSSILSLWKRLTNRS
ncbi:MAG: CHAP domain-containing protein, partial [Patescibacteria group bacterium]|nr:CHAP domain-containing protein [Patescibacteria group bacterium]